MSDRLMTRLRLGLRQVIIWFTLKHNNLQTIQKQKKKQKKERKQQLNNMIDSKYCNLSTLRKSNFHKKNGNVFPM